MSRFEVTFIIIRFFRTAFYARLWIWLFLEWSRTGQFHFMIRVKVVHNSGNNWDRVETLSKDEIKAELFQVLK